MAASKLTSKKKKKTVWQRHRVAILIGGVVFVVAAVLLAKFIAGAKPTTRKPPNIMAVALPKPPPPPTPPPPTPPPPPPKPEDKVIPKDPVKPIDKPIPKPPAAPPALGSAIKGSGKDGFGLSGSGDGVIGGLGDGTGGGDQRRWYAGQVQSSVVQALRNNKLTRNASFGDKVRVWVDASGRITKVEIASSSGNAAIDNAIKNEILIGLRMEQAPPGGKLMYVDMRLNARRPN